MKARKFGRIVPKEKAAIKRSGKKAERRQQKNGKRIVQK